MSEDRTETQKVCLQCRGVFERRVAVCPQDGSILVPDRAQEDDPLIGVVLSDRYEIVSVLGKGGMGVVYLAKHQLIDRMVAVKVLKADLASDEKSLLRFQTEARAARRLHHPNVVSVHDFGVTDGGQPYLVMDYVDGQTLASIIKAAGCIEYGRCMSIFIQACNGLEHAHRLNILHRDIKPSNIALFHLEGQREMVKLLDFGAAKLISQEEQLELTKAGEVLGSPHYMSPEQCKGMDLDARSDIYSLGASLYESLIGAPPHQGKNAMEIISKQVNETPRSFAEAFPEMPIPEIIEDVVFKSLAKDRDRRFQSMAEMRKALEAALDSIDDDYEEESLESSADTDAVGAGKKIEQSAQAAQSSSAVGGKPQSALVPDEEEIITVETRTAQPGQDATNRLPLVPGLIAILAVILLIAGAAWLFQSNRTQPRSEKQDVLLDIPGR